MIPTSSVFSEWITNRGTFESLKSLCPSVPSLQQVVERFGNKMHLMIEVKHEHYPNPEHQNTILEAIFPTLSPVRIII